MMKNTSKLLSVILVFAFGCAKVPEVKSILSANEINDIKALPHIKFNELTPAQKNIAKALIKKAMGTILSDDFISKRSEFSSDKENAVRLAKSRQKSLKAILADDAEFEKAFGETKPIVVVSASDYLARMASLASNGQSNEQMVPEIVKQVLEDFAISKKDSLLTLDFVGFFIKLANLSVNAQI